MNFFTTEINCEGYDYELNINTIFEKVEGALPDRIEISVKITQIVSGERHDIDNLNLEYITGTREYNSISTHTSNSEGVDLNLYDCIIKKLDETFNNKWGDTTQ